MDHQQPTDSGADDEGGDDSTQSSPLATRLRPTGQVTHEDGPGGCDGGCKDCPDTE
jgi:hypothetical protein